RCRETQCPRRDSHSSLFAACIPPTQIAHHPFAQIHCWSDSRLDRCRLESNAIVDRIARPVRRRESIRRFAHPFRQCFAVVATPYAQKESANDSICRCFWNCCKSKDLCRFGVCARATALPWMPNSRIRESNGNDGYCTLETTECFEHLFPR